MHIFIELCALLAIVVLIDGKTSQCEYTSREYQIVLRADILSGNNSFASGVSMVLDELDAIENSGFLDFKVSRSSLTIKNVTSGKYSVQHPEDLNMKITMKSRQKKPNEPADFVLKFSNADPSLACVALQVDSTYADHVERKFELDFHAINGKIMTKSAISYTVDMPSSVKFTQTEPVNLSSIFLNSAKKLTQSGRAIIAQPVGQSTQETAEFMMRIAGAKVKGVIILLERAQSGKSEFSFRVSGNDPNENILMTAQQLASTISRSPVIAQYAGSSEQCGE